MSSINKVTAGLAAVSTAAAIYFFIDNRSLRNDLDNAKFSAVQPEAKPQPAPAGDPWKNGGESAEGKGPRSGAINAPEPPALPEAPKESKLDRRARRTEEFAAMFGRLEGESEEDYKARVMPLIKIGLDRRRQQVGKMREEAERKAGVTPEQHAAIDKAFEKTFSDVLDYTNTAVKDRQLSPYERNVSGWLEFAGGLGGMLNEAQGQVGKILSPEQVKAMYASGFEWGEYLGVNAPWENLKAPPPPPK